MCVSVRVLVCVNRCSTFSVVYVRLCVHVPVDEVLQQCCKHYMYKIRTVVKHGKTWYNTFTLRH